MPLLIGGATTCKLHTAVKIAPRYSGTDRARARRLARVRRGQHICSIRRAARSSTAEPRRITKSCAWPHATGSEDRSSCRSKKRESAKCCHRLGERRYLPTARRSSACARFDDLPLRELEPFIDWTPFFHTWELRGTYPDILDEPSRPRAKELYDDAQRLLERIIDEQAAERARGLRLLAGELRRRRHRAVRRRIARATSHRHHSHAAAAGGQGAAQPDSRSPISSRRRRAACTTMLGALRRHRRHRRRRAGRALRKRSRRLQRDHDQSARRSAGRSARGMLHKRVRDEWGTAPTENLTQEDLIARNIAASVRRPAIRRVPITPRSARCSSCSMPKRKSASR